MMAFENLLVTYTALLCCSLGVTPRQIRIVHERNGSGFSPRPEGALGFYY